MATLRTTWSTPFNPFLDPAVWKRYPCEWRCARPASLMWVEKKVLKKTYILANVAWALRSLTHSTLNATPGQLVFSRDMLFDLKYVADWQSIRKRKEQQVRRDNERENSKRTNYSYKVGGKVLVKGDHLHILRKTQLLNNGPFIIDEVNKKRGTLTITDPNTGASLPIHIRRVRPFYK